MFTSERCSFLWPRCRDAELSGTLGLNPGTEGGGERERGGVHGDRERGKWKEVNSRRNGKRGSGVEREDCVAEEVSPGVRL